MPRKRIPPNSNTALFKTQLNYTGLPWKLWARKPSESQFQFFGSYADRGRTFSELQRLMLLGFEAKPEYLKTSIFTPSEKEAGK